MNNTGHHARVTPRLAAIAVALALLASCASSDATTPDSTTADSAAPAADSRTADATAGDSAAPAADATTESAATAAADQAGETRPSTAPTADSTPFDENGALACDGAAMQAAIGDPDFVTFDEISCADGWAGAGYIDTANVYTPVIFKAEGQYWVLQDRNTVCDRHPEISPAAQIYCPG